MKISNVLGLVFLTLFVSNLSLASLGDNRQVEGVVKSSNGKMVKIESETHAFWIDKSLLRAKTTKKVKNGMSVKLDLTQKEFETLKPAETSKKKKKKSY